MCIQIYAVPAVENRVSADRLSRVSGLSVKKVRRPVKGAFSFSRDGGCSCSLLAETADWGEPVWALVPEILDGLAVALQVLGKEAGGFTFLALWMGDKAETKSEISLSEMLKEVRNNQVKNWHTYIVKSPDSTAGDDQASGRA